MSQKTRAIAPAGYVDSYTSRASLIQLINEGRSDGPVLQAESFEQGQRGLIVTMTETPLFRPDAVKYALGPAFTPTKAAALEVYARGEGRTIVEIKHAEGYAIAAALTPAVKTLRDTLAAAFGVPTYAADVNASWAADGKLNEVQVRRLPQMPIEKAEVTLRGFLDLILQDQRAVRGWTVSISPLEGLASLHYGEPLTLPKLVPYASMALDKIDPSQWYSIPVGRNARGEIVEINLKAGPHALIVGGTGAGKSVTARALIAGALARGFEVICGDPTKQLPGLQNFIPYLKGFFVEDSEEIADVLDAVYAEVRRRVGIIFQAGAEDWLDLPAGTLRPWLVMIDEWGGLVILDDKPIGDQKTSPAVKTAFEEWAARAAAVSTIQNRLARIAREARSAGIHLMILTQRPDTKDIPGQVREQMGTVIQLVPPKRMPSRDALGMVFSSDMASLATDEMKNLADGRPGFGLAYADGAAIEGFRAAFIDKGEVTEYLDRIGVPAGIPLFAGRGQSSTVTPAPAAQAEAPAWMTAPAQREDPWG